MCSQNSLRFYGDIAYDCYNGLVLDDSHGDHLAGGSSYLKKFCNAVIGQSFQAVLS